jgi:hypothetical protein
MEQIRAQVNKYPLYIGAIAGGLIGLIVGLIFAWVVWPVKYTGAYPRDLIFQEKVEYLRMAIEAYDRDKDAGKAQFRYKYLETDADKALTQIIQNPDGLSPEVVVAFSNVVTGVQPAATQQPSTGETPGVSTAPAATAIATLPGEAPQTSTLATLARTLGTILCVLALIIAAVLAYIFIVRSRQRTDGMASPAMQAEEARRQAAWTDYSTEGMQTPIAQFMASYKLGDDLFDDSFSIDSASGEFLGECGVGISDTIGVGDPKKVTAFEVWLFDKNDIQTITKVVMSDHAFNNLAIRQRLEAKGEPVQAQPGAEIILETQTLQLSAKVVDMSYGQGALPEESFFESFILELAIWPK